MQCPANAPDCDGGVCGPPPSCQVASGAASGAGQIDCGISGENCCTSLEVDGGIYYRTYSNSGTGATGEADPATLSGFRLDKYLVTVGRFRQFVDAWNGGSGYLPVEGSGKHTHLNGGNGLVNSATQLPDGAANGYETGWDATDWNNTTDIDPTSANLGSCAPYSTWTATAGSQENLPINCVTWYEAYAFCIWDGGFLPSEAEWEYVAAGGSQQREYPWGSTAPGTGNQYAIYDCYYPSGSGGACSGVANIAPVGTATLGAASYGQLDMVGEVFEWNLDWYNPYVDPCTDCAYLGAASDRLIQGGDVNDDAADLLLPNRDSFTPALRSGGNGVRCARTP